MAQLYSLVNLTTGGVVWDKGTRQHAVVWMGVERLMPPDNYELVINPPHYKPHEQVLIGYHPVGRAALLRYFYRVDPPCSR
jgi:hypothetical protein